MLKKYLNLPYKRQSIATIFVKIFFWNIWAILKCSNLILISCLEADITWPRVHIYVLQFCKQYKLLHQLKFNIQHKTPVVKHSALSHLKLLKHFFLFRKKKNKYYRRPKVRSNWRNIKYFIKNIYRKNLMLVPSKKTKYNVKQNINFMIKLVKYNWIYKFKHKKYRHQLLKQQNNRTNLTIAAPITNYMVITHKYIQNLLKYYKKSRKVSKKKKKLKMFRRSTFFCPPKIYFNIQTQIQKNKKLCGFDIKLSPAANNHYLSQQLQILYKLDQTTHLKKKNILDYIGSFKILSTKRVIKFVAKKNKQSKILREKSLILKNLFYFYKNNISINYILPRRYININILLKIQTINCLNLQKQVFTNFMINIGLLSRQQQLYSITNFFPLTYFLTKSTTMYSNFISILYMKHLMVHASQKYKNFYTFFLIEFLEKLLQKNVWIRVDARNFLPVQLQKYIDIKSNKLFSVYKRFNRLISILELMEIIIRMFITRDLQIFLLFMKRCFERSHFKKHKKILSILFDVLKQNKSMMKYSKVKGFFFDIRGKVGVSGNAKKRHVFFSLEKITTTSQNVRSYWQQINVWTPTGQMGITCYIVY